MKAICFLFILFISNIQFAQTIDVLTGITGKPNRMLAINDEIYYSEGRGNKISKIDISSGSKTALDVVTGIYNPGSLVNDGTWLYIAISGENKISKIDVSSSSPILIDVLTGLNQPNGLALNGNDLYYSESSSNKISKIDISNSSPTPKTIVKGLDFPAAIALKGDELFISEIFGDKISKINISLRSPTPKNVINGIDGPIGIKIKGDFLYVTSYKENKLNKFNISTETPILTNVVGNLQGPTDILFLGNDLYISENAANKISKLEDINHRQENELYISNNSEYVSDFSAYGNGDFEIDENGRSIRFYNSGWHKATINQSITENTHLEFEFKVNEEHLGRIVGIGFDTNNELNYSDFPQFFQLAGSYIYDTTNERGYPIYNYYTTDDEITPTFTDGWVHYSIPVGKYFTGNFNYLTFGATGQDQEAFFRNIELVDYDDIDVIREDELYISNTSEQVSAYSDDDNGNFEILESGQSIRLFNSAWKKATISQTITADTYLAFELKVSPENLGRVVGIGFDTNNKLYYSDFPQFFQLAGTYIYDNTDEKEDPIYDYYTFENEIEKTFADSWVRYSIPVGQYFTGDFDFLTFGASGKNQAAYFRNIEIFDKISSSRVEHNNSLVAPLTEVNEDASRTVLFPNPTVNTVTVIGNNREKTISIFSYSGQQLKSLKVSEHETVLDFSGYPSGIYLVQILDSNRLKNFKVVKK
ncbi:T9SS type A sorting domain-containing protein [Algibacter mikhailovii]|uniref:T9SS type A sorting domain-containing protein n=1 Tax=Algibacter mikhailovii TaxID=425498 RepID=UPI002494A76D|nr:T9SS type A sorting domain-containing protein [Algibacter mikhailovii]